jgi:Na+-translocating ferredoxin:NAD+ oxidoreductase RnfE subunit
LDNNRRALLLGLAAVLLWSTAATAFKLALAELSVLQLLAVAVSTSALALDGDPGRAGALRGTARRPA